MRLITAALKMISDMERIGDQAEDIAEIITFLGGRTGVECKDIRVMAEATIKMVTESIDAFVKKDVVLAESVLSYDDVVDDYFGTKVADPYRWLEDDNSQATAAWVEAQNKITSEYLSSLPAREKIKSRLEQLWDYPTEGAPSKHGNWYYISRNSGLQNQSVIYRKQSLTDTEEEVFLDPNTLSEDGTVALNTATFSKDGKLFAYSLASAGRDWVEIFVMDAESKTLLKDHIKWVKFSGASWSADSKGFYYSAYDAPKDGDALYSAQNTNQKVYYHRIGTSQSDDTLVYADPSRPLHYFNGG